MEKTIEIQLAEHGERIALEIKAMYRKELAGHYSEFYETREKAANIARTTK